MSKDIVPRDEVGQFHGYCERYWGSDQLSWGGVMVHGKMYGYFDVYNDDCSVDKSWTGYWTNGNLISKHNKEGYCYIWEKKE